MTPDDEVDRGALARMFPTWDSPRALGYGRASTRRRGQVWRLRTKPSTFGARWHVITHDRAHGEIEVAR